MSALLFVAPLASAGKPQLPLPTTAERGPAPSASSSTPLEWHALEDQAVQRLSAYLRIDTANPPGNELPAAQFLQRILESEGISSTLYPSAPGRANLVARLRGNGSKRPLLLLNHLDVVPADATAWKVPPFSGTVKDGVIWGRGAIDMKSIGIMQLTALIALKRSGVALQRDVIFMAVADEEAGGELGAAFMLKAHAELFSNLEYVLNEGSRGVERDGRPLYWEISPGEKAPLWLQLVARGTAGHASRPFPAAATHRLARALGRLASWEPPVRVLPEIQEFFATIAPLQPEPRRTWFSDIRAALQKPEVREDLSHTPDLAALVRDTVAITLLKGSAKMNVLPSEASAGLDCRLLPGTDPDQFLKTLREVIADDGLTIVEEERNRATSSPSDSEAMQVIRRVLAKHTPGVPVVSPITRGASDSRFFRERGISAYGVSPYMMDDSLYAGMHGVDERISVENLQRGCRIIFEVVEGIGGL